MLVLAVAGCDKPPPYWTKDMPGFEPVAIYKARVSQQDLLGICGYATHKGCTLRYGEALRADIYLGPEADECTFAHELRHARGWNHDNRTVYRDDCGEG